MSANKKLPASAPEPAYRKELEYLYARRLVIDSLIESLEDYNRFRAIRMDESELRTA